MDEDLNQSFDPQDPTTTTVQTIVVEQDIKSFDDSYNTDNTKKSIKDAFDFNIINKNVGSTTITVQNNAGEIIPTISTGGVTEPVAQTVVTDKTKVELHLLKYELGLEVDLIEDGTIDVEKAAIRTTKDLETASMNIMIFGEVFNEKTKKRIKFLRNPLITQGTVEKADKDYGTASSEEILAKIAEKIDAIEKAGFETPDTLLIDSGIYRKWMFALSTNVNGVNVYEGLKNLNLTVYPSKFLKSSEKGSCLILYKKDKNILEAIVGKLPVAVPHINNAIKISKVIKSSIGGFVNTAGNPDAIQIITNLEGSTAK